jgi:uncharacterized protein YggE
VVSGQGEVQAAPDRARVRLGIEERAASAEESMNHANKRMTQIIAALKERGVLEKDIQTTELSMYFEQLPDAPDHPAPRAAQPEMAASSAKNVENGAQGSSAPAGPKVQGVYVVRNTVLVTIAEINQVGAYIGAAMSAGANALHGLELFIEDPTALRDEARKQAVKNARDKAQILANEAEVKLGEVIFISEGGAHEPVPMMSERAVSFKSANVPVATGELSLTQHVQVTFAIEE